MIKDAPIKARQGDACYLEETYAKSCLKLTSLSTFSHIQTSAPSLLSAWFTVLNILLFLHPDSFLKLQFQYNPFFTVPEAELHSSLALFPYLVSCFISPIILLHSNCLKHIYKPSPTVSCFLLYHYRTDLYHPMKLFLRYIQLVQKAWVQPSLKMIKSFLCQEICWKSFIPQNQPKFFVHFHKPNLPVSP